MVSQILLQFVDVQSFDDVLNGGSDVGYAGRGMKSSGLRGRGRVEDEEGESRMAFMCVCVCAC